MKADSIKNTNVDVIKKFYAYLDEQNLDDCNKLFVKDSKGFMGSSDVSYSFKDVIPMIQMYYTAFPDYKHQTEFLVESGDYVITRQKYTGTHKNEFMGLEPTGKQINYKGIFIFRLSEGKISELWGVEDNLTMMEQLGMELKPQESEV